MSTSRPKGGRDQIEGKSAAEPYTLAVSGPTELAFTAADVNGLSISRYAPGAKAAVAYSLA
jgi:hypothetical protein